MFLAGDIGGTKTLLGVFEARPERPHPIATRSFQTVDYPDLVSLIAEFMNDPSVRGQIVEAACFGVAGPVFGDTATLTNVPWRVEGRSVARRFGFGRVDLLNDLQAMAYGVTALRDAELYPLQEGHPVAGGNIGLIAAGTGLGEALLHNVAGSFIPSPSEGGHADFAARNDAEIRLLRWLISEYGRAEVEAVLSGPGLLNIHRVTHESPCLVVTNLHDPDAPAMIAAAALTGSCRDCGTALEVFVDAYGAEAGNLALRVVATGGLYIGGGIAPKILPLLGDGRFIRAFRAKAPLDGLLSAMPVKVILNPQTALLGAAVFAAAHFSS